MSVSDIPIPAIQTNDFNRSVRRLKWHYFREIGEFRPDLYKYCRSLARNPFDAEDLVQETLLKAFAMHAASWHEISNQKAFLLRVASNIWIDQHRKKSPTLLDNWDLLPDAPTSSQDPLELSQAILTLIESLPPRERTTVLLKDVYDYKLEEIAEMLVTSVPAVKAALHRGRQKLKHPVSAPVGVAKPATRTDGEFLKSFQTAFNAHDVNKCISLFMQTATAEVKGLGFEAGIEALKDGTLGQTFGDKTISRIELQSVFGRQVFLVWHKVEGGSEVVRNLFEMSTQDGLCAEFSMYYFSPEFLAEVCRELATPFLVQGYGIP